MRRCPALVGGKQRQHQLVCWCEARACAASMHHPPAFQHLSIAPCLLPYTVQLPRSLATCVVAARAARRARLVSMRAHHATAGGVLHPCSFGCSLSTTRICATGGWVALPCTGRRPSPAGCSACCALPLLPCQNVHHQMPRTSNPASTHVQLRWRRRHAWRGRAHGRLKGRMLAGLLGWRRLVLHAECRWRLTQHCGRSS